jgi:transcriptional regulator with XRE-family HTH domain
MATGRQPLDEYLKDRIAAAILSIPADNQALLGERVGLSQREISRLKLKQRVTPPASLMDRIFREAGTSLAAVLAQHEGKAPKLSAEAVAVARLWEGLPDTAQKAALTLMRGYRRRGQTRERADQAQ